MGIKKNLLHVILIAALMMSVFTATNAAYAMGESGFIAAGWGTTFYITSDGTLWGFGSNSEGLLGNGKEEKTVSDQPARILDNVKSVAVNRYTVLAVKRDGTLWYWGRPAGSPKSLTPVKLLDNVEMAALEDNNQSILVVKSDGTLLRKDSKEKEFQKVQHGSAVKFVASSATNRFFIDENDELWGWGGNSVGALGAGQGQPVEAPVKIMDSVQHVGCSNSNTLIVRKDASLWFCGAGDDGKYYDGEKEVKGNVYSPIKIMDDVLYAAGRNGGFYAVKRDNTLWTWGNNGMGIVSGASHVSLPVQVASNVSCITIGMEHLAVAKTDNTAWTGGDNWRGGISGATVKDRKNELRQTASNIIDLPAAWAIAEVREAEYRKLVPPSMQSEYSKVVNRSEFCTLAITCIEQSQKMTVQEYMKSKGIEIPESPEFTDIASLSETAKKDIMAARALGIVAGTSETTFDPYSPITREQAAKMLTATASALGESTQAGMPSFADGNVISAWAKPYIGYVFNAGIMSGVGDNRFDPNGGYQRQQAYMTVLRVYKKVAGIN